VIGPFLSRGSLLLFRAPMSPLMRCSKEPSPYRHDLKGQQGAERFFFVKTTLCLATCSNLFFYKVGFYLDSFFSKRWDWVDFLLGLVCPPISFLDILGGPYSSRDFRTPYAEGPQTAPATVLKETPSCPCSASFLHPHQISIPLS